MKENYYTVGTVKYFEMLIQNTEGNNLELGQKIIEAYDECETESQVNGMVRNFNQAIHNLREGL